MSRGAEHRALLPTHEALALALQVVWAQAPKAAYYASSNAYLAVAALANPDAGCSDPGFCASQTAEERIQAHLLRCIFGNPFRPVTVDPAWQTATVVSLAAVLAAASEEVYWAGITAVPAGQWEAARSTGMGFLGTLLRVVLPQALRLAIPPLTNWTIAITKGTALGAAVAVPELIGQALSLQSIAANPSPLTLGALLYLVIFAPLVQLSRWIERRWARW